MNMFSAAIDAVDAAGWAQVEVDAIMATIEPMPKFEPLASGLCGYSWWDNLPWGEGQGAGYRCTKDADHPGSCESRGSDGTVYATLRAKTRALRQQIPARAGTS